MCQRFYLEFSEPFCEPFISLFHTEEVRAAGQLLADAEKTATDLDKSKKKAESERDDAYNALEVRGG